MIKSLLIERFRCFEHTHVDGLGVVNLFSGKNNSGKTALLEALFLASNPSNNNIIILRRMRQENLDFVKELPSRAWDNFFFKQENKKEIFLKAQLLDGGIRDIKASVDESVEDVLNYVKDDEERDIVELFNSLSNKEAIKSTLHIDAYFNAKKIMSSVFTASEKGIVARGPSEGPFKRAFLIPANLRSSNKFLATEFDKAKFEGNAHVLLEAFQIIDPLVESIDTYKIGDTTIYLKRKNEKPMPIAMFGDAINKVADFVLSIVNNQGCTILIDEIENGIHYTNQESLWGMMFKLARRFDVQMFTTTHSKEMTDAFVRAAKNLDDPNAASFFELARHAVTDQIIANRIGIETLDYKLENNKPFRGEPRP